MGRANASASPGLSDVRLSSSNDKVRFRPAIVLACVQFQRESFGALHQMLSGMPEPERSAVWDEITIALERFETAGGFVGPCELLVASGTK